MTRSIGIGFSYATLLLAIGGSSVASAADSASASIGSTLTTPGATTPPSNPVDVPPRRKPPQEAFDACKSHSEGEACSVTFNGHTMSGACRKGPNGESELACALEHPPGPPPNSNSTLSGAALERELDGLEAEIHGA